MFVSHGEEEEEVADRERALRFLVGTITSAVVLSLSMLFEFLVSSEIPMLETLGVWSMEIYTSL